MTFYRSLSLNAVAKMGNGTVRQSKKSITLITSYQLPHRGSRSFTFVQDDALLSVVILSGVKNGPYKDKTCYVLSPKTAHSKKCFRPSPCGGKGKRFFDGISIFPALKRETHRHSRWFFLCGPRAYLTSGASTRLRPVHLHPTSCYS